MNGANGNVNVTGGWNQVKRKTKPLGQTGCQLFLFALAVLLFNWPLLRIAGEKSSGVFFAYLYLVWIFVILLLFMIGRSLGSSSREPSGTVEPPGSDNV